MKRTDVRRIGHDLRCCQIPWWVVAAVVVVVLVRPGSGSATDQAGARPTTTTESGPPPANLAVVDDAATAAVQQRVGTILDGIFSEDPTNKGATQQAADQGLVWAAALRDSGLLAAEHDAVLFTTMDYRTATQDLATWTTAATGSLSDQLRHGQNGLVQLVLTAKTATTSTLDSAGPTEVDPAGLTVKVLALVTVHITTPNSALTNKTIPLDVTVTDTDGQWLASLMNELPGQ